MCHPFSRVVADGRDAEADDEHVEPGPEQPAASENRSQSADEEMARHRDYERRYYCRPPAQKEERQYRYQRTNCSCASGQPRLAQRRHVWLADLELFPDLLAEHARGIVHDLLRKLFGDTAFHPLGFIHERELVALH